MSTVQQRASGCLFGLALGDALGAHTEFLSLAQSRARFPPDGPREPLGDPARVTDDTQMTLAVGEALLAVERERRFRPESLEESLRRGFVAWLRDPENDRAPGATCLQACRRLARDMPWTRATVAESKGCGANMRVAPVGLLLPQRHGLTPTVRAAIAQLQSALTHGHPTALAASDLTAYAIADLCAGGTRKGLVERLIEYAESQRRIYHGDWLESLWQHPGFRSPEEFIEHGWHECLLALRHLADALGRYDGEADPCGYTGAGWIAEEALATALLCFLHCEDPVRVLRRAALTTGDSDSIACLAGAFAGAHLGVGAWPAEWCARIEYRDRLAALGRAWDA